MHVAAATQGDVQRDSCGRGERRDCVFGKLRIERGTTERQRLGHLDFPHHERPPGKIEGHLHECLVEWIQAAGEAPDAGLVAHCLSKRFTEADGDVFDGVMRVDVQVATGGDPQIEAGVLADLFEHVVVERDARRDLRRTGTVDLERQVDRRLLGDAMHRSATAHPTISAIAPKNSSFSSGVPIVTRKQSARRGHPEQSRIKMLRSSNSCHTCRPGLPRGRKRMKLAPLGTTSRSSATSAENTRSRSEMICCTRASISSRYCSARRPAICLAASRWYGSATLSSSATNQDGPTR